MSLFAEIWDSIAAFARMMGAKICALFKNVAVVLRNLTNTIGNWLRSKAQELAAGAKRVFLLSFGQHLGDQQLRIHLANALRAAEQKGNVATLDLSDAMFAVIYDEQNGIESMGDIQTFAVTTHADSASTEFIEHVCQEGILELEVC